MRLIYSCRRSATILFVLLFIAQAAVAKKKARDPEDLFNPLLGVEYSHWLVGPIADIASNKEVDQYLQLVTDDQATEFIEAFWQKRNEGTDFFRKSPRQIFDQRSEEADKRFSEGAFPGSSTDRGKVLIVFGEPAGIEFESPKKVGDPTLEVWSYAKDSEPGLGGEKPKRRYQFVEIDGKTVRYTGQARAKRPDYRDRLRRQN